MRIREGEPAQSGSRRGGFPHLTTTSLHEFFSLQARRPDVATSPPGVEVEDVTRNASELGAASLDSLTLENPNFTDACRAVAANRASLGVIVSYTNPDMSDRPRPGLHHRGSSSMYTGSGLNFNSSEQPEAVQGAKTPGNASRLEHYKRILETPVRKPFEGEIPRKSSSNESPPSDPVDWELRGDASRQRHGTDPGVEGDDVEPMQCALDDPIIEKAQVLRLDEVLVTERKESAWRRLCPGPPTSLGSLLYPLYFLAQSRNREQTGVGQNRSVLFWLTVLLCCTDMASTISILVFFSCVRHDRDNECRSPPIWISTSLYPFALMVAPLWGLIALTMGKATRMLRAYVSWTRLSTLNCFVLLVCYFAYLNAVPRNLVFGILALWGLKVVEARLADQFIAELEARRTARGWGGLYTSRERVRYLTRRGRW
mmetsp:Transcript_4500/g.15136  ORF Transcript_4500/g.15136 Transcript_4500/m.15136 type:complete len:428 (+) Transcript_4500:809-2092(+)